MDEQLYLPFVRATISTFSTMLGITPELVNASRDASPLEQNDVCGIMGLSGDAVGMCSIAFSEKVALKSMGMFLGEEMTTINEDIYDAVGEILNIVAGAAKAEYTELKIMISLPSIMHGEKVFLSLPKNAPVVTLNFKLPDIGEMILVVSMKTT